VFNIHGGARLLGQYGGNETGSNEKRQYLFHVSVFAAMNL
jgi:hypothetical protein